jgi:hypothetical protein
MSEINETTNTSNIAETIENTFNIAQNTEPIINKTSKPDYSTLFQKRGRPKMKPEDKKPRKRRSKKQPVTIPMELEAVELKDHLQEKVHKLEVLKGQWNDYYRKNRERILCRKKELREAKERMLNESMGVVQKIERRGRKRSGDVGNVERVCGLKCLG